MSFHHPYHFVPVRAGGRPADIRVEDWRAGGVPRLRHDRYADGTLSGRILCRLESITPFFVGAERRPGAPATVEPFLLGGEPAIPASSLRGMISAVAEAASNSALRVLTAERDGQLSFRREMGEALSAIGMVVEVPREEGGTELRLRPLCLPNLPVQSDHATLPRQYWTMFGGEGCFAPLKVYLGDRDAIRDVKRFPYRTFHPDRPHLYGWKLRRREWQRGDEGGWVLPPDPDQRRAGPAVIADRTPERTCPRPWEEIPLGERAEYVPGILRVLGVWDRGDIPATKKHELFLPLAEPWGEESSPPATFPILASACERFHQLADQRTEARATENESRAEGEPLPPLPYEPRDTARNLDPDAEGERFRLKNGDLVYFRPSSDGFAIEEIALSSIWRGRVERGGREPRAASTWTFFETLDAELVPFHTGREILTPAEQLFGFVAQDRVDEPGAGGAGRALAGRVHFSFGLLGHDDEERREPFQPSCTLQVLASPKPPSPALYFRPKNKSGYIPKNELDPAKHLPQGRKFYLHQREHGGQPSWEAPPDPQRDRMRSQVTPLRKGLAFYFHVDFDNLTAEELGLLCYALRPSDDFLHKLGMGKPLGLGSVRIDPLAILYIDRAFRYGPDGWFGPRYTSAWRAESAGSTEGWPGEWSIEIAAVAPEVALAAPEDRTFEALRRACAGALDPDLRRSLELLGETVSDRVKPPLVDGQHAEDGETYKWFVANGRSSNRRAGVKHDAARQSLEPLDVWLRKHDRGLPMLEPNPWAGDE